MDVQTVSPISCFMTAGAVVSVLANTLYGFAAFALALAEPHESDDEGERYFIAIIVTSGTSLLLWLMASVLICIGAKSTSKRWDMPTKVYVSQLVLLFLIGVITIVIAINHDFHPNATDEEKKTEANSMSRGITIFFICAFNSLVLFINSVSLVVRSRSCRSRNDGAYELQLSREPQTLDVVTVNTGTACFGTFGNHCETDSLK
eukprot:TRINITY_DN9013_c0_g1_i1.p1 TRINITY_DN9013_c0_g1~~TRINITY_DN9013_c0_g1_i1.p1  ORF type:complete len:204 (+),score=15.41 TRINITY_DN9013_c0_g1_i1:53-664(+)